MIKYGGGWADRAAVILAVVFVAALVLVDVTMYRPQRQRLRVAETELQNLQTQLAGIARRNLSDQELLVYADTRPDGGQFRNRYSSEPGLVYLTRILQSSGLGRIDFKTEGVNRDGPFRVERFYVVLKGPFSRALGLVRNLEGGERLVRLEQVKMEPIVDSTEILITFRAAVYGMAETAAPPSQVAQ